MKGDLEDLIDKHGLQEVLRSIVDICFDKADHIRSNWQDDALAKEWDRAGSRVGTAADSKTIKAVSR